MSDELRNCVVTMGGAADLGASTPGEGGIIVPFVAGVGDLAWNIGEQPEFVPADVLCAEAEDWIGKPITFGHPKTGKVRRRDHWNGFAGTRMSSTPVIGEVVAMERKGDKLVGKGLLREADIKKVPDLVKAIDDDKVLDNSIGTRAVIDRTAKGSAPNGEGQHVEYQGKWDRITEKDHIALLVGKRGACNTNMGAGLPRAASEGGSVDQAELKKALESKSAEDLKGLLSNDQVKGLAPEADPPAELPGEPKNASEGAEAFGKIAAAAIDKALAPVAEQLKTTSVAVERLAAEQKVNEDKERADLVGKLVTCSAYTDDAEKATDDCPHVDGLKETPISTLRDFVRVANAGKPASGKTTYMGPFNGSNTGPRQGGSQPSLGIKFGGATMKERLAARQAATSDKSGKAGGAEAN